MQEGGEGIVLGRIPVKSNAHVVHVFLKDSGKRSFYMGPISKKKKGSSAAILQPLTIGELEWRKNNKSDLLNLSGAKISEPLFDLQNDVYKSAIAFLLAEILNGVLKEEKDEDLFTFLKSGILILDHMDKGVANFHIAFLLRLTRFLGFYPNYNGVDRFFDLEGGEFTAFRPQHMEYVEGSKSELIARFLQSDWTNLGEIKMSGKERTEILEIIMRYYTLHFPGFRTPKSLEVLIEIFE